MRRPSSYALLLIALLCGASLHAQTPAPPAPPAVSGYVVGDAQPQTQYSGSVSGHVYCADTNAPARFARVTLVPLNTTLGPGRGGSVSTGLDGSFQIQNIAPGTYYISAVLSGYIGPLAQAQVSPADIANPDPAAQERIAKVMTPVIVNGSETAHAEIRLERGAAISGTVYYDDGSPAVHVAVTTTAPANSTATSATPEEQWPNFQPSASAFTDDYGRYRIPGLAPGDYVVIVTAQVFVPANFNGGINRAARPATLTLYAPKAFRAADAKVFTIKTASELSGVDIQIPIAAFHTVSGSAESSDGHALNAGDLLLIDSQDKTRTFRASVGSDGQFHILYVPEGSYTLSLTGAAITAPDTTSGDNGNYRGRPRTTVVQSFGNATQSVLVENGDVSVVVQAPPLTQTQTPATASPTP